MLCASAHVAQVIQTLNTWATMVLGELSKGDRAKLKTMSTIDVHARDAVMKLVTDRVELVDEEHARRAPLRLLKQRAHPPRPAADEHLRVRWGARDGGDGPAEQ